MLLGAMNNRVSRGPFAVLCMACSKLPMVWDGKCFGQCRSMLRRTVKRPLAHVGASSLREANTSNPNGVLCGAATYPKHNETGVREGLVGPAGGCIREAQRAFQSSTMSTRPV